MGIIGSNGAGKSTLLRILLHQLTLERGNLEIDGVDVNHYRDWAKIGYVPQSHHYLNTAFPATVEEILLANMFPQIGLFRFGSREHRRKVRETLRMVDMESHLTSLVGTLSGGQLQRVLIARALVNSPKYLFLDEPTTGIDTTNTQLLYELLARLNHELGLTVVMVTHDVNRAANYLQRTYCLEDGSLVALEHEQLLYELEHKHKHPGSCVECQK